MTSKSVIRRVAELVKEDCETLDDGCVVYVPKVRHVFTAEDLRVLADVVDHQNGKGLDEKATL